MIRLLAPMPAAGIPGAPPGAVAVNEVEVDGTRMVAAYFDDGAPAMTEAAWRTFAAGWTPPPPPPAPADPADDVLEALAAAGVLTVPKLAQARTALEQRRAGRGPKALR